MTTDIYLYNPHVNKVLIGSKAWVQSVTSLSSAQIDDIVNLNMSHQGYQRTLKKLISTLPGPTIRKEHE